MALPWLYTSAAETRANDDPALADSLTVSLITCYPGPEIYELCGHEAIRVRGEGRDSVWNYGVFNFNEPNFVYRFVKGETDYMCAGYPFAWFLPEYRQRGSRVVEQELNLTQTEARKLLRLLQTEALPQNSRYRYNYVKDNCATRILDRMDEATGPKIVYPDSVTFRSFRDEMRAYHRNYPWYQFGIDLALGSGIDHHISSREEMFVPMEMMAKAGDAHFLDGRKLVRRTNVLVDGEGDVTLPATPWWATPLAVALAIFAFSAILSAYDLKRNTITRWAFFLWFMIIGLAGTLVAFLVFISSHEATDPNTLLLWLNPLQLIMAVCVLSPRLKAGGLAMAWFNIIATICLLIVWPAQHQCANAAVFPLIGATLLLSATYAIIARKDSYNINRGFSSTTRKPSGASAPKRRAAAPKRKRQQK